MRTLHINVTNKVATFQARDGDIVCGNTDYQIAFTFDAEWDEHQEKTARFIWNGQYTDIPFTGNTCPAPMVKGASVLTVGVYAGELRTTTPAEIGCRPSVLCVGGEPVEADQRYISEAQRSAEDAYTSAQVATDAEGKALNAQMWAEEAADQARQSADRAWSAAADAQSKAGEAVAELRAELSPRINRNTEDITILGKKVTNLELGVSPDPFVTDTTGKVPVNALPYAEVVKVGGMTYRDTETNTLKDAKVTSLASRGANLVINEYKDTSGTKNGVTFTVHEDGSVTANGTAEGTTDFNLRFTNSHPLILEQGKTYTLSGCPSGGSTSSYRILVQDPATYNAAATDTGNGKTFTAQRTNYYLLIRITSGVTVNNLTFKPMLVEGDKVVPFKPYRADAVDTLEIPEAVQALDGYGQSNLDNKEEYNYIDWGRRLFVAFGHIVDGEWVAFEAMQEIDISDLLPEDNFIEVEGGGTIVAVNAENLEAPTAITYMTKEV